MPVLLCHKCSGVLANTDKDTNHGLNGCKCISGYVRGFQRAMSIEEAASAQVQREIEWIALYVSQGRVEADPAWQDALRRLKVAMKKSNTCGHGTVKWSELGEEIQTTKKDW